MGTDKPQISTVARLAGKLERLELVPAEAAVPTHDLAERPVDRVSLEATERVTLERKISAPVIGPAAELAREISVPAIALAVEPVRCR